MKHWHMWVCVGLVAVGVALAVAGVGGAAVLLPVLGCMAMMGAMMLMMRRGSGQ